MGVNRVFWESEQKVESQVKCVGAFMAVPAMLIGVPDPLIFQQRLYQWAFEQARQAVEARRPAPTRDLFAIMN
jgi:hypothetical protein